MPWDFERTKSDPAKKNKKAVTAKWRQLGGNIAGRKSVLYGLPGSVIKIFGMGKKKILGVVRRGAGITLPAQKSDEVPARYIRRLENVRTNPYKGYKCYFLYSIGSN